MRKPYQRQLMTVATLICLWGGVILLGSLPAQVPPRSGIENRDGLKNLIQKLVQLRAERTPHCSLGSSLIR